MNKFVQAMRSLSLDETKAVAWELAHASYNWALAIEKPSRLTRAAELHYLIRQALGAADLVDAVSKRNQLGATKILHEHLRGFECPGHRQDLLTMILKLLWPPDSERVDLGTILPDGMTKWDVWDLCQLDWCSVECSDLEKYPQWLQMTPLEIIRCPVEGSYCRLPDDNPLTILFQWSLALHNGSAKLQDPLTLQQWHQRASSISPDHNVWRFESPCTAGEEDDTADFQAYVQCYPTIVGVPIHLQWAIDRKTACANIEKLHLLSTCQLQPLMRRLWPETQNGSKHVYGHDEAADAAESFTQVVIHRLFAASSFLWLGGRASSNGAASSEQLRLKPRTYVKQLVFRCGFRGEAAHDSQSVIQIDHSQQDSADASEINAAQKRGDSSGRGTGSSLAHESRSEADVNADALLLEEEAEKARAEAQKQARQQRRARKSGKAGSSTKHPADGLSRPQQAPEAQSSGEAAGAQPAEMPAVMSPLKQSASDPPQDSAGAASGCEQRTDISSSAACLQIVTSSLKAMALAPTADDDARPSSALHMSSPTKSGSANAVLQSPAAPQDAHPTSPAAENWQGLQPCGTSSGAAGSDEWYEAEACSALDRLAYSPGALRITEPLEQQAAANRDTHSSGDRQPWKLVRQGQSRLPDPGSLQGAMANESLPQSQHRPLSPPSEGASEDVPASIGDSAGRCQPRATSRNIKPSAQVRAIISTLLKVNCWLCLENLCSTARILWNVLKILMAIFICCHELQQRFAS